MTIIIAEAGVNHNGCLEMAFKLVEAAAMAGADIVKFQTFKAEELATNKANKAKYQLETTDPDECQQKMLKRLELSNEEHIQLVEYCKNIGIEFLSTGFDSPSIQFLRELDMKRWKIPSGEITNLPYLREIATDGKPIILSTGMANLGEIEAAIDVLIKEGIDRKDITIMHCTTEYPAPFTEVNLRAMRSISKAFEIDVGYSDHTKGIAVPISAVALGAKVIEKHLTLDRTLDGPDHKASLEPMEFASMVEGIRSVEMALGSGIKRPTTSERRNQEIARKSIVAIRTIDRGEILTTENIGTKRPGTGLSPMYWDECLGRKAARDYKTDDLIEW